MSIESAKNHLSIALSILKDDVNVNNIALVQLEQALKELEAVPVPKQDEPRFTIKEITEYINFCIEEHGTLHDMLKHIDDIWDGIVVVTRKEP